MTNEFSDLASSLLPAVVAAGARTMRYFGQRPTTEIKGDGSPVTIADREAEAILMKALNDAAPQVPVVAEEASTAGQIPNVSDRFFLVDPLDGTKEFINGRSEFTVNVGLVSNGAPVFGIIYAPALANIYITLSGNRAIHAKLPFEEPPEPLAELMSRATQLKTRSPDVSNAMTIVASRSHGSPEADTWLQDVNVAQRTNIGSSLKFCLIAQGDADIYPRFGPTKEWDTCAGHAIVLAAGGLVTREDSATPLRYGKTDTDFLNPVFIVWGREDNPVRLAKASATAN